MGWKSNDERRPWAAVCRFGKHTRCASACSARRDANNPGATTGPWILAVRSRRSLEDAVVLEGLLVVPFDVRERASLMNAATGDSAKTSECPAPTTRCSRTTRG